MAASRAVYRLAFLILLIPVGLLVTLHFFGENRMDIPIIASVKTCDIPTGTRVFLSGASLDRNQKNQLSRVNKALDQKSMLPVQEDRSCFGDTTALILVDRDKMVRGAYYLEQTDVNRLFAELDILRLNESYGEGVSR